MVKNGWTWLGLSTARISRQPIAIYEVLNIRKEMRATGFEDAFLKRFTDGLEEGTHCSLHLSKRVAPRLGQRSSGGHVVDGRRSDNDVYRNSALTARGRVVHATVKPYCCSAHKPMKKPANPAICPDRLASP